LFVVAVALAEQKLTMEHVHKSAIDKLQRKLRDTERAYKDLHCTLSREKDLAVAETKKKQWVLVACTDVDFTQQTARSIAWELILILAL